VVYTCHHIYAESVNRRITIQTSSSIKQDPISKITKGKRVWGVDQVVALASTGPDFKFQHCKKKRKKPILSMCCCKQPG
jgi:hypothetical protein